VANDKRPAAFDEQKAIAELERLKLEIEKARRHRGDVETEFDEFVRRFKTPAPPHTVPKAAATQPISARIEQPRSPAEPMKSAAQNPSVESRTLPPLAPAPRRVRWWHTRAIRARDLSIAGAGLAVLAGVVVVREWRSTAPPTIDAAPAAAPEEVDLPATRAIAPAAAQPADVPSQGGLDAQLTATRRVWVRVLVDGERAVERELPAGTVLPFRAERTLAVRIGDAGAVRLVVNGRDAGPLGPDGQIVVRTFTAPGR
jgi:hypothetical protein